MIGEIYQIYDTDKDTEAYVSDLSFRPSESELGIESDNQDALLSQSTQFNPPAVLITSPNSTPSTKNERVQSSTTNLG